MTWSLFKFLLSNSINFASIKENSKKGPKGVLKIVGIVFLFLFIFVDFSIIFGVQMVGLYSVLAQFGKQELMPVITLLLSLLISFFFSFLSISTVYYTGTGEEQLMALPLYPKQIFTAKFAVSLVTECLLSSLFLFIGGGIYAYFEGLLTNPGVYVGLIISAITISTISIFVIFLIFIAILTFFPILRNKKVLQAIASFIIIVFSCSFGFMGGFYTETGSLPIDNSMFQNASTLSFPKIATFFASALYGNWFAILAFLLVFCAIFFVFVPFLSESYMETLNGFSDIKTKKIDLKQADELIQKEVKEQSLFKALYLRDIKTVLREPSFFANGPLLIILMPLIFIISFSVSFIKMGQDIKELFVKVSSLLTTIDTITFEKYFLSAILICSAISTFIGSMSSIAATSFSREGKAIYNLKALPINEKTIISAKFFHALTYSLVSNVIMIICIILLSFLFGLKSFSAEVFELCVLQTLLSVTLSTLLIFIDMFLDTANPKLQWDNPTAAFKQNVNSGVSVLLNMVLIGLYVFLVIYLVPKNLIGYFIILLVSVAITMPVGYFYIKYAVKKFPKMME